VTTYEIMEVSVMQAILAVEKTVEVMVVMLCALALCIMICFASNYVSEIRHRNGGR
jgi:hypothetical protein